MPPFKGVTCVKAGVDRQRWRAQISFQSREPGAGSGLSMFPFMCHQGLLTCQIRHPAPVHVLAIKPNLQQVEVLCQVNDVSTVIPRNSVVEANLSGLSAAPLLDVTPLLPLTQWHAGPHEEGCGKEGAIVCKNGRLQGRHGVAVDDLVYLMTRLARQVEGDGHDKAARTTSTTSTPASTSSTPEAVAALALAPKEAPAAGGSTRA